MEAVILAGGDAWRMKPYLWIPKPLAEVAEGVTLLEWQVAWLRRHGFRDIYVCARGFRLEELDVYWVEERRKLGTGGALRLAAQQLRGDRFYACNCDDILLDDPRGVAARLEEHPWAAGTLAVAKPRLPWGVVKLEGDRVARFVEKPLAGELSQTLADFYVSVGHYAFDRYRVLPLLPEEGDLEATTLPTLASNGTLCAYVVKGRWLTVNTYKDLLEARRILSEAGQPWRV
jgi:NDP-sugar pyrophosphorylase family protein